MIIPATDLILNDSGSVYHLNLLPGDIADTILLVGDKDRVPAISGCFDSIELKKEKREFVTHTGLYKGKRLTVVSTGIGTDNIDIVINELDALANIDLVSRKIKTRARVLNFIRLGTSGSIQADLPVDVAVLSAYSIGLDNLMSFYKNIPTRNEHRLNLALNGYLKRHSCRLSFYATEASERLARIFNAAGYHYGITITSPGFYAPQQRRLRYQLKEPEMISIFSGFQFDELKILNFEMETSALYGLAKILGHRALTIDLVVGNRQTQQFSPDYKTAMGKLIKDVLDKLARVK